MDRVPASSILPRRYPTGHLPCFLLFGPTLKMFPKERLTVVAGSGMCSSGFHQLPQLWPPVLCSPHHEDPPGTLSPSWEQCAPRCFRLCIQTAAGKPVPGTSYAVGLGQCRSSLAPGREEVSQHKPGAKGVHTEAVVFPTPLRTSAGATTLSAQMLPSTTL